MRGLGQRGIRATAIFALAVVLLVPLALSRHAHAHPASRTCATCVVAHHSIAVATPVVLPGVTLITASRPAAAPALAPRRLERSPHAGRAPPRSVLPTIG